MNGKVIWLLGSLVGFVLFIANVATTAAGNPPFIGRIGEVLLLFLGCVLFVIGTLKAEAARNAESSKTWEGNS